LLEEFFLILNYKILIESALRDADLGLNEMYY